MRIIMTLFMLVTAFMAGTIYSTGKPYGVAKKCAVEDGMTFVAYLDGFNG